MFVQQTTGIKVCTVYVGLDAHTAAAPRCQRTLWHESRQACAFTTWKCHSTEAEALSAATFLRSASSSQQEQQGMTTGSMLQYEAMPGRCYNAALRAALRQHAKLKTHATLCRSLTSVAMPI